MTPVAAEAVRTVYVLPGEMAVGTGVHIMTILGSCVAVCLLDRARGIGGMNHYLLPQGARGSDSPRFADVALPRLLEQMLAGGATRLNLEAKIFGGARVLARSSVRDLGRENVQAADAFLEREGIRVVARSTGGDRGRKLILQTSDGVVWLRTF